MARKTKENVVKSIPKEPGAFAVPGGEIINGVRLTRVGDKVEILDLHSIRFETFKVDADRHPGRIVNFNAGRVQSTPWLSEALPEGVQGRSGDGFVTVDDLKAALASAPERPSPSFPTPSAARVRAYRFPFPWDKPDDVEVRRILAVAVALAWRGGKAYDMELEGDLVQLQKRTIRRRAGHGGVQSASDVKIAARSAMDAALKWGDGNIRKEGRGNFAVWRMSEEWKREDPNERVRKRGRMREVDVLEDLFGDDA